MVFAVSNVITICFSLLIGLLVLLKKPVRFTCGLAGGHFMGLLSLHITILAVCPPEFTTYLGLNFNENELSKGCQTPDGANVFFTLIGSMVLTIIGFLVGCFARGNFQKVITGLGVGSIIATFVSWFPAGLIVVIVLQLLIAGIFGYIQFRYPGKLLTSINWIGSYYLANGLIVLLNTIVFAFTNEPSTLAAHLLAFFGLSIMFVIFGIACFMDRNKSLAEINDGAAYKA